MWWVTTLKDSLQVYTARIAEMVKFTKVMATDHVVVKAIPELVYNSSKVSANLIDLDEEADLWVSLPTGLNSSSS